MWHVRRLSGIGLLAVVTGLASGCGTNLDQVLLQTATATGRTVLDIFLTEYANNLVDQFQPGDQNGDQNQDGGGGTDNGGTDNGGGSNGGGGLDGLTGDAAAGETVFSSNNCAGCHCADASGGCALSAPSIVGMSRTILDEELRGSSPHPVKVNLSDQEIVDLEAYLASL